MAMPDTRPTLRTERLILRPFRIEDASHVQRLAGAREVASTTGNIPHPYADGIAEAWIGNQQARFEQGEAVVFAITLAGTSQLIGAIGLELNLANQRAELGYWIGVPFWNQGYCTEAARAVLAYGFRELGLHRIVARHFTRNPASGRVMQKIGMQHEGSFREHVIKWGAFESEEFYGILKGD